MYIFTQHRFEDMVEVMRRAFLTQGSLVENSKHWQGLDISDQSQMTPIELRESVLQVHIPYSIKLLQEMVKPNLSWAEDHFLERVSGIPYNPPPSHEYWPHQQQANIEHRDENGKFSHTYPERFWPKKANEQFSDWVGRQGIRYEYGDLDDVVNQLRKDPLTRQAYLPVWFPEDTGAVQGQRVPCTLGYHFMIRKGRLHCTYHIRSCDFRRHFRDDVYLAGRLMQWMTEQVLGDDRMPSELGQHLVPGELTMHIGSFHVFAGDIPLMQQEATR